MPDLRDFPRHDPPPADPKRQKLVYLHWSTSEALKDAVRDMNNAAGPNGARVTESLLTERALRHYLKLK